MEPKPYSITECPRVLYTRLCCSPFKVDSRDLLSIFSRIGLFFCTDDKVYDYINSSEVALKDLDKQTAQLHHELMI